MSYSGGLARNIEQCLNDFNIPLKLSHTVVDIHGKERLTGVTIAKVDERRRPIPGTEEYIPCDTLLLSCGLIPENELAKAAGIPLDRVTNGAVVDQGRETSIPGVFACGNVLHVHDLVDYVSAEAEIAGRAAAEYIKGNGRAKADVTVVTDGKVRYTVPQSIRSDADAEIYFRVADVYRNVTLTVKDGDEVLYTAKTGRIPAAESPAAKVRACSSAMPTSKKRSGCALEKGTSPVPSAMAAVMAQILGSFKARSVSVSPK
jgi:hypothetical protein